MPLSPVTILPNSARVFPESFMPTPPSAPTPDTAAAGRTSGGGCRRWFVRGHAHAAHPHPRRSSQREKGDRGLLHLEWLVVISLLASLFPLGRWQQLFDGLVEIAPSLVGLLNLFAVEFLVFRLGKFPGHLARDSACVFEDGALEIGRAHV